MAVNILYTASWIDLQHTQQLKPYKLTPQQFNILRILRGQHPNPATINILIDRMIDKSSNASRLVDRLEQKGFVNRCVNESDKRAVNVRISEKGLLTLKEIDEQQNSLDANLKNLSKEESNYRYIRHQQIRQPYEGCFVNLL
jgi:DNA-binding MarR family transcriptional regulator